MFGHTPSLLIGLSGALVALAGVLAVATSMDIGVIAYVPAESRPLFA